jgi:putative restriction endonuclease
VLTTKEQLLNAIRNVGVFQKDGQRAVHKPLLMLIALAEIQSGNKEKLVFPEVEGRLEKLIREFGATSRANAARSHYPFWYLRNDGFWKVENENELTPRKGKGGKAEPGLTTLRVKRAKAGFSPDVIDLLSTDATFVQQCIQEILRNNFPETLHVDIIFAVGLDGEFLLPATKRDSKFREEVLRAYSYSCAVCGYDGRLGMSPVGIEAAHIRWVQFGGPNSITNGFAMCALHHKIFDLGGLTIEPNDFSIVVSKEFNGVGGPVSSLHALHKTKVRVPPSPSDAPHEGHLNWHYRQIFRGPSI